MNVEKIIKRKEKRGRIMSRCEKNKEKKKSNRYKILGMVFTCFMCLLITRIYFIQIIEGSKYKEMMERQSRYKINHINSRGTIYDRNMISLTNAENATLLLVDSDIIENSLTKNIDIFIEQSSLLGDRSGKKYKIIKSKSSDIQALSNVFDQYLTYPIQTYNRYYEEQPAVHLIGYVNQWNNTGAIGLERSFESLLNQSEPEIYATVDAKNNIIPGLGFQIKKVEESHSLVTTLDIGLQKEVEKILKERNITGAVVILDTENGNILTSASSPTYNPNKVEEYLQSKNEELFNKAIQVGYPPGSIFKIIVAAAGLENGIINEKDTFICNGYEIINDTKIKCTAYEKGGHGEITLEEAFSVSCNSAFIQMGQKIGSEKILEMSKKFGLGSKTGVDLKEEYKGNLPSEQEVRGAGIGNLSVGQGSLLVTPLQCAKATAIIANGGIDKNVNLVKEIIDWKGNSVKTSDYILEKVLSTKTAGMIEKFMEQTVKEGTANNLKCPRGVTIAGKTGSAQSVYSNQEVVHGWFTGYAPSDNPKYVITVFIQDGRSGRLGAVPVVQDIIDYLFAN